jgi:hypothetical protein
MEDIIDIIVTETTNTIEITAQPNDEIIDVNIIDNREDITLNVTPTVVEININSLTSNFGVEWGDITGTLSNQTDLNNALALKANLVGGKVPSSELPSYVDDVVEVATFSALPATGEIGKIYVILDTNKIYRWSGSVYVEIADSTAVWGAITGTLSSQTDLQSALNAKFDDPTGDTTQYIAGDGSLITFPVAGQSGTLVREVRNTTGATLTKGTIVYISGATGNKPTVSKAIATGDSTSAQTFGMCQANISNNSNGYVVCVGDLGGLDTSALTEGAQLYLSSTTAGTYTTTKQLAPNHLVYIGVVTRAHPTQGQIEVKIQNGYELDEIHDVAISSLANNDGLFYESSTDLWKNKSIATVLGYTPANDSLVVKLAGAQTITGLKTFSGGLIANVSTGGDQGFASTNTSTSATSVFVQNNSTGIGILANNALGGDAILIGNDTSGRGIYITNATISGGGKGISIDNYNSGIGIEVGSDSSADAIKVLHLAGRAFNIQSSGGGYGVIINNTTASTSAPFTIQKQGASVITLTDAGAGTFNSSLTASSFVKTSGTSAQFLKADGSVDSSVYALDSAVVKLTGNQTVAGIKTMSNVFKLDDTLQIKNIAQLSNNTGYTGVWAETAAIGFYTGANAIRLLYAGNYNYTMPSADGTLALTSQLSSYLPLSGGTLTGALSGTSATFSDTVTINKSAAVSSLIIKSSSSTTGLWLYLNGLNATLSNQDNGNLSFQTNGTDRLTLASTGAATFSSSVTATSGIFSAVTSINIGAVGGNVFTVDKSTGGNIAFYANGVYSGQIDATTSGSLNIASRGTYPAITILTGGNVGIGTTAPASLLDVVASTAYDGVIRVRSTSTNTPIVAMGVDAVASPDGYVGTQNNVPFGIRVNDVNRIWITTDGNVGIGTTSPNYPLHIYKTSNARLGIEGTTNFTATQYLNSGGSFYMGIDDSAGANFTGTAYGRFLYSSNAYPMCFFTDGSERMRITSSGHTKISSDGTYLATGSYHEVRSANTTWTQVISNKSAIPYGLLISYSNASPNVTGDNQFIWCDDTTNSKFIVWSNGNVVNRNNSYGAISDIKLKENITDTTAKLADLLKVKIRNYNLIGDDKKQLGVIAQELEEIFPNMIEEFKERNSNEITKSVKYSVFVPMLIKAVQELSDKITTLENK